jgi:hypothetical protein
MEVHRGTTRIENDTRVDLAKKWPRIGELRCEMDWGAQG